MPLRSSPPSQDKKLHGFALLLSGNHAVSMKGLSKVFEGEEALLARKISRDPVVLARGISLDQASHLVKALGRKGVAIVILPSDLSSAYPCADLKVREEFIRPTASGTGGVA